MKAVVIEDEILIRAGLCKLMKKMFPEIEVTGTAGNGQEGLLCIERDKPDMIILDPPRDGIHPKALPKIISYAVDRIVYISCKPTSLVRDLEVFLESGYVVKKAVAVDQFPWTTGIESICLLEKE